MLVGYNNNVTYKGTVYHVQTEDSGVKNPMIVTLLYNKGTILARKKIEYKHLLDNPDMKTLVREMMKEQHKAMLKELIAGKHTGEAGAGAEEKAATEPAAVMQAEKPAQASKKQESKTLDDILLDYIMTQEKK